MDEELLKESFEKLRLARIKECEDWLDDGGTMDDIRLKAKEECHYLKKRPAGDEVYYWCDLSDHPCGVEYNDEECEEYNDFLKELEEEAKNGRTLV